MQFEKVNEVPKRSLFFRADKETKQTTKALSELAPGEILVFRIDRNQPRPDMYREANRREVRLRTAMRNATGEYVMQRRDFDTYITCLENQGAQP